VVQSHAAAGFNQLIGCRWRPTLASEIAPRGRWNARVMATAQRSRLVGRVTELDAAREALASARSGEGRLVFVHGEAGIGKTRLCQELRATQDPRRTQVLAGRADPGDAATMFSALADSLRAARR